jgi:dipeptidyl aminopeptidase/acylaminoacyl peptidase
VLNEHPNIGSICSGGRYDDLASHYTSSKLPGVGISIGATRLFYQLKEAGLIGAGRSTVQALVTQMDEKDLPHYLELATQLRGAGIATEVQLEPKKLGKQFQYADRAGIRFVLVLGENEIAKNTVTRLTTTAGEEEEASFSPDGAKVAFVRANDLYVVDLAGRERRLTTDGTDQILNGKLDYVYQEEVYGRGIWKAYWWSPDSSRVAFLQLDERPVPEYTVVDHIPYRLALNVYDYPKAGDPNPRVKLFVVPASGGPRTEADTERYSSGEILIVNVAWSRDGKSLTYQVQNREQTWLDLVSTSPSGGASRTLFRETTKAWVDPLANPSWRKDGSFIWQSERTGYRHLEQGAHAREEIIETLAERHGVFIYERDVRKLSHSLTAFDAFVCAYTALLSDADSCADLPKGFPAGSGWLQDADLGD